jgi:hypothetical protein
MADDEHIMDDAFDPDLTISIGGSDIEYIYMANDTFLQGLSVGTLNSTTQNHTHTLHIVNNAMSEESSIPKIETNITLDESETGQNFNFKNHVVGYLRNDELVLYYEWMADSATMSHICIHRDAFIDYQLLLYNPANSVLGIGEATAHTKGCGTV